MVRWNGCCVQHPNDGGIHIKGLWGTGTDVEDGCAYGLEVPSNEREAGSQDEAVCVPTCVDRCRHVLCKHVLDEASKTRTRRSSREDNSLHKYSVMEQSKSYAESQTEFTR